MRQKLRSCVPQSHQTGSTVLWGIWAYWVLYRFANVGMYYYYVEYGIFGDAKLCKINSTHAVARLMSVHAIRRWMRTDTNMRIIPCRRPPISSAFGNPPPEFIMVRGATTPPKSSLGFSLNSGLANAHKLTPPRTAAGWPITNCVLFESRVIHSNIRKSI